MPRLKLTKSSIDTLLTPQTDIVYWDAGCPGFGVKVTPKGRKVFVVLYRTGGAGSSLRKIRSVLMSVSHFTKRGLQLRRCSQPNWKDEIAPALDLSWLMEIEHGLSAHHATAVQV
jgi:hypothetical protein